MISASTRSRSRDRFAAMIVSSFSRRIICRTASMWPCGTERSTVNRASGGTNGSSRKTRRSRSTFCAGHCDKFASVRLRVIRPSRQLSRNKMAGGDPRFGTVSTNMDATVPRSREQYKTLR